jgi:hypothetical protein
MAAGAGGAGELLLPPRAGPVVWVWFPLGILHNYYSEMVYQMENWKKFRKWKDER